MNYKYILNEYNHFMDEIFDEPDEQVHCDIIKNNLRYFPKTKQELKDNIKECLSKGINNLNCIDVSEITDFSELFKNTNIDNINITSWDVSNGKNFRQMFYNCKNFNCDLSYWNVSNGEDFSGMFICCKNFNSDISDWDVSSCRDFSNMFYNCHKFNSDLSRWDVSNGLEFCGMFNCCLAFNSDLSRWNLELVENTDDITHMFFGCKKLRFLKKIIRNWNKKFGLTYEQ